MRKKPDHVEVICIEKIKVINPRSRNKFTHDEIIDNINNIGLKRPITVRRIEDPFFEYALICGQGRLEAFQRLHQTMIPAIIKDVDEETAYIMSLAENIARRKPRSTELLEDVRNLKLSGLTDKEIGDRLGYTVSWVNNITMLLDKGEKKLLSAFEAGNIPLYLAVEISRSNDNDIQDVLTEACEKGDLKGKKLAIIKNILEQRKQGNKYSNNFGYVTSRKKNKITPDELLKLYQNNINEHKNVIARSDFTKENLRLTYEIMNDLLRNDDFVKVIKRENINSIPSIIIDKTSQHKGNV